MHVLLKDAPPHLRTQFIKRVGERFLEARQQGLARESSSQEDFFREIQEVLDYCLEREEF